MIRWLLQSALCLILCPLVAAQQVAPQSPAPAPAKAAHSSNVRIKKDALILLRPEQGFSSADARAGDKVRFTLMNDFVAEGQIVIQAGTTFYAVVTSARPKDAHHDGSLRLSFTEPDLGNGKPLRLIDGNAKERKELRNEEIFWLTYGTIILAPILVPMLLIILIESARHSHKTSQGKIQLAHLDQSYAKDEIAKFYVQHTVKICADQLPAPNASMQTQ